MVVWGCQITCTFLLEDLGVNIFLWPLIILHEHSWACSRSQILLLVLHLKVVILVNILLSHMLLLLEPFVLFFLLFHFDHVLVMHLSFISHLHKLFFVSMFVVVHILLKPIQLICQLYFNIRHCLMIMLALHFLKFILLFPGQLVLVVDIVGLLTNMGSLLWWAEACLVVLFTIEVFEFLL